MQFVRRPTELSMILLLLATGGCIPKADRAESRQSVIQEYEQKICNGANTCDLVDQVPAPYRTLKVRNCMCDEQCSVYDDCCEDAKMSGGRHVPNEFTCVATAFDGGVSMKTSCPASWSQSEEIKENCQRPNASLVQIDTLLTTPVTNVDSRITYRNLFCAVCHGENDFLFWSIGFTYKPFADGEPAAGESTQLPSTADPDVDIVSTSPSSDFPGNGTTASVSGEPTAGEILKKVQLNETDTTLFWMATVRNVPYKLSMDAALPDSLADRVRFCQPNVVDTCAAGSPPNATCAGFTSYVYLGRHTVYKNPSCFDCNANLSSAVQRVSRRCPQSRQWKATKPFTELHLTDKRVPKVNRCSQMPKASSAYALLCQSTTKNASPASAPDVCRLTYRRDTGKVCRLARSFPNEEIEFRENGTIYLKPVQTLYPSQEWLPNSQQGNATFVCGSYITGPYETQLAIAIEDWLTAILLKLSLLCLALQLLVFALLPELQNLSGKCLAAFCTSLAIAYVCFDTGPRLRSCVITAVLVHFSLLCCFTWMLLMSYDCWLSLYRATAQLRSAGGKHAAKFVVYIAISLAVPSVIVGVSVYLELAPGTSGICNLKPRYGHTEDCFIFSKVALFTMFVLPASLMLAGNIGFFAHTAFLIYSSQRQTVNPNTRHDFLLYTRLALLMGLTWTLGSLTHWTGNRVVGFLFTVLNSSQGICIFFGFTFKRKVWAALMKKYGDNQFISSWMTPSSQTVVTELQPRRQM